MSDGRTETERLRDVVHALEVCIADLVDRVVELEAVAPRRRRCGTGKSPPRCMGMAARGDCTCVGGRIRSTDTTRPR